ncbi:hypothetical protein TWF730_002712 [Orbilia blumenaviensis]|uniref:Secreted protein n=1 Tax=Orbilia blumenaviensis TaxID=1796055 RepID=A0AAV9U8H8_9PEZI
MKIRSVCWMLLGLWKICLGGSAIYLNQIQHQKAYAHYLEVELAKSREMELMKFCSSPERDRDPGCRDVRNKTYYEIDREHKENYLPPWPLRLVFREKLENYNDTSGSGMMKSHIVEQAVPGIPEPESFDINDEAEANGPSSGEWSPVFVRGGMSLAGQTHQPYENEERQAQPRAPRRYYQPDEYSNMHHGR